MAEFNIRSESVDVEQIMQQIRARIREKRGVDYTEEQVRELATVRLETFLDPRNLRSDLLDQFRKSRPAVPVGSSAIEPPYGFDDQTLFASHRAIVRFIRRLLRPVLTLFFNPNTLNQVLQRLNTDLLEQRVAFERTRGEWNVLYYEVLHNLVIETTRATIEVKNLKMRLESLASRLDFSERRVRALEGVVQYRPEAVRAPRERDREKDRDRQRRPDVTHGSVNAPAVATVAEPGTPPEASPVAAATAPPDQTAEATARRRRRRRRGRRGSGQPGGPEGAGEGTEASPDAGGRDEVDASAAPRDAPVAEPRQDSAAAPASGSSSTPDSANAVDPHRP